MINIRFFSGPLFWNAFFRSARSLSVSRTPPAASFLGSRSPVLDIEQRWFNEPLLGEVRSPRSGTPKIKTMLCVVSILKLLWNARWPAVSPLNAFLWSGFSHSLLQVSLITFLVGSHSHLRAERLENNLISRGGTVFQVGRKLLEVSVVIWLWLVDVLTLFRVTWLSSYFICCILQFFTVLYAWGPLWYFSKSSMLI